MKPVECRFEAEVLGAVLEGCWPERADADLVAHAAACAICSEVAAVAVAMAESREEIGAPPAIPDSGLVWWVAQRRARLEAAEIANRPIRATQTIALVCAIAIVCGYFGAVASRVGSSLGDLDVAARLGAAARLLAEHAGLALAIAAVILLVPAVAYLAIGRE